MIISAQPAAAAATDLCSDPTLQSASVQSTLQVNIHGVDWPSMTSTTHISVPQSWRGTSDLFGDATHQGAALACFTPINTFDYEAVRPDITVQAAANGRPAMVYITDIVTMTDGPEALQTWQEGPWTVTKQSSGYDIAFQGQHLLTDGSWTVTVEAPGLSVLDPLPQPTTDDGQGELTWSFPAPKQPAKSPKQPAKQDPSAPQQVPHVSVSLPSPWQVRMNLHSDLWPVRWLTDATWTLGDGVIFDVVVLLLSWRLLRRKRRGNSGKPSALNSLTRRRVPLRLPEEQLPRTVFAITFFSVIAYAGYLIDDYLWHTSGGMWSTENMLLVYTCAWFFLSGLGVRGYWILMASAVPVVGVALIAAFDLSRAPTDYSGGNSRDWGVCSLLVLMIPLLLAMTFAFAGAVTWISRLWPFGAGEWPGLVRRRSDTWLAGNRRVAMLVTGALVASALILVQSAFATYYYWLHSDLWRQGSGALTWLTLNLMNDAHWWIGDGIQWALFYTILVGVFAVLRTMRADARGAFFGLYPSDRGDLWLMAALAGSMIVGTWGFYDGVSLPIPFIVALVLLIGWGLTRRLSRLEKGAKIEGLPACRDVDPPESLLGHYQNDILAAADHSATTAARSRGASRLAATGARSTGSGGALQLIPLKSLTHAESGAEGVLNHLAPKLELERAVDPGATALALGPGVTWWDNGVAAVKAGMYLTVVPIAFDIYILWNNGSFSLINYLFGLQDAIGGVASNVVGWLAGLFMFGVLCAYLRGVRTPLKGAIFGLIAFAAFASDAGIRNALGVAPYPTFVVDGLLAVALFATTGLLLDIRTLRVHNDQGMIASIYRLGSVRVAVTYATTLIIVGVSLWQAVYLTGQTAQQRAQNLSTAAQQINQTGGSGNH